ncbi:MAG: hypothetical protein J0H69_08750 [Burkholderiales bacterium]|nr:hypothetical protein [Burkholderiales bacterium]
MDELAKIVQSPVWWISVVVVGLLINWASSLIPWALSTVSSKAALWWRARNEARRQAFQAQVDHCARNPQQDIYLLAEEMRHRLRAASLIGIAVLLTVLWAQSSLVRSASIWMAITGLSANAVMLSAGKILSSANRLRDVIKEARKLRDTPPAL